MTMKDLLTEDERDQLILCAIHPSMIVKPVHGIREPALRALVRNGYLQTVAPADTFYVRGKFAGIAENAVLKLTAKGREYILALKPEDFQKETWFPLPKDIKDARNRVAAMRL
jgi:hypothetical protein